jgi:hypothetical protein
MEKDMYKILKRYVNPTAIKPEDWEILVKYREKGLVKAGYVELFGTGMAALTDAGCAAFREEELRRHPFKRFAKRFDDLLVKMGPW